MTGGAADRRWSRQQVAERAREARAHTAYGLVLLALSATIVFDLAAPDTRWATTVQTVLGAMTLAVTLVIAGASRRVSAPMAVLAVAAVVVAAARGFDASAGNAPSRFAALAITVIVLIVIGRDLVDHPRITVRTLLGAISFYLLIGLVFARTYAFIASLDGGRFFAQPGNDSPADYLYFSFVTQTTVGFGDLTPVTRIGRAFTIGNALIGQLYLVTVIALFVSTIGRERRPSAEE